jgi:hypothetical protein
MLKWWYDFFFVSNSSRVCWGKCLFCIISNQINKSILGCKVILSLLWIDLHILLSADSTTIQIISPAVRPSERSESCKYDPRLAPAKLN